MSNESKSKPATPSLLQITWSMIAAFCGVQNSQNHDVDDAYIEQVGFKPYIIIGMALTLAIIFLIYVIVQIILRAAS